ncbi:MAG: cysteine desulfurase [Tenericutes bacterium]|nr:cysteine desulfurase [Mycoplasmatota bacterium]
MIYLDYSATTPPNIEVLDAYHKFNQEFFANSNSSHELGLSTRQKIKETGELIQDILDAKSYEVIYTSGATESNNLALKGFAFSKQYFGKHIITSPYEHSSVTSCLNYLAKQGFEVDVLSIDETGKIDLDEFEELIRKDTILVSIALINAELGIRQDLVKIKEIIKRHPHVTFHSDMTQAIGKLRIDLSGIDLISFSAHKFYGLKGIGVLLRKRKITLEPVVHGGKSTSIYRGGTPAAPLIYALGVALELAYKDFDIKHKKIQLLREYLIAELQKNIKNIHLNYEQSIPQINNFSFPGVESNIIQESLSKKHIYISSQSACSSDFSFSVTVKKITNSNELAKSSIRISLSHLTEKNEIDVLVKEIKVIINENH